METLIDSLSLDEQKEVDPALFTCCPSCRHEFKIPDKVIEKGLWLLHRTAVFHNGTHLDITAAQSNLLYQIAKSGSVLSVDTLSYRTTGINADGGSNVVVVQLCRLRKLFKSLNIKFPIHNKRGAGYYWNHN